MKRKYFSVLFMICCMSARADVHVVAIDELSVTLRSERIGVPELAPFLISKAKFKTTLDASLFCSQRGLKPARRVVDLVYQFTSDKRTEEADSFLSFATRYEIKHSRGSVTDDRFQAAWLNDQERFVVFVRNHETEIQSVEELKQKLILYARPQVERTGDPEKLAAFDEFVRTLWVEYPAICVSEEANESSSYLFPDKTFLLQK